MRLTLTGIAYPLHIVGPKSPKNIHWCKYVHITMLFHSNHKCISISWLYEDFLISRFTFYLKHWPTDTIQSWTYIAQWRFILHIVSFSYNVFMLCVCSKRCTICSPKDFFYILLVVVIVLLGTLLGTYRPWSFHLL